MKLLKPLLSIALALAIAAPVAAQYTINMRDVDVRAFANDAAKVTGRTMIVDGRVNQKVSVGRVRKYWPSGSAIRRPRHRRHRVT